MKNLEKKRLSWINPTSHYVYQGWMYFFDKYYNFSMYDEAFTDVSFGKHVKIKHWFGFKYLGNGFNFISNKRNILKETKNDVVVCGDIFCFDLCYYYYFRNNSIFYSEAFIRDLNEKSIKKILLRLAILPFFRRKMLVPTLKSERLFRKISNKVLYFPPIYYGDIFKNKSLTKKKLKIMTVGFIDDWKKNYSFLIEVLNELHEEIDLELHMVGGFRGKNKEILKKNKFNLIYHGKVDHKKIKEIYLDCNLFIQPSLIDPIGAVVLEAMAHGLPVLVSKNAGSSDYMHNKKNGFVFDPYDKEELKKYIKILVNKNTREKFGNESLEIIKKYFWYKNEKLLEKKHTQLGVFINEKV